MNFEQVVPNVILKCYNLKFNKMILPTNPICDNQKEAFCLIYLQVYIQFFNVSQTFNGKISQFQIS